jgi:hypothetical protein
MTLTLALTFAVLLDGEPIGSHRFEVSESGDARRVVSSARFDVKVLGIPVYRYRHHAVEQWRGDCLVTLDARTEHGGDVTAVATAPAGCVMSFAYWHPRMLEQTELLNAQTGALERVAITSLGEGRYRITGTPAPIELAYSPDGAWLGLETTVTGERRLSYRLQ